MISSLIIFGGSEYSTHNSKGIMGRQISLRSPALHGHTTTAAVEGSSYILPIDERGEDEWRKTVINHCHRSHLLEWVGSNTTATDGTADTSHLTNQPAYQQAQHGRVNYIHCDEYISTWSC